MYRVAPNTNLARYSAVGYPANNFAGYPVWPDIWLNSIKEFFFRKNVPLFSFQQICLQISVIY